MAISLILPYYYGRSENQILQCLSTDDRQNPHFSRAMKQIECLEPEEISGLVDW